MSHVRQTESFEREIGAVAFRGLTRHVVRPSDSCAFWFPAALGGGVSESQQRVKQIDQGALTLTTKRLVFDGTHENRNVQLSQVLSVSPWADAIEISTARRAKSQIYTVANPLIWAAAVKAIAAGEFSERRTTDTNRSTD
jgi:hypothetical protein